MKDRFLIKEEILKQYGVITDPLVFYRDVFPVGSFEEEGKLVKGKANGVLCSVKNGEGVNRLIFDDLKEIEDHLEDDFVILSPIAYFGKRRSAYNSSLLYGIVFDLDEVGEKQLSWILERLENPHFPRATYIVNSGGGLHIYYLLKSPIPLYKSIHKKLNEFKHNLTRLIWNKYTSEINVDNRQYQGIFQGFRMVGTKCKIGNGHRLTAYKTGDKVDIEYLNQFVSPEFKLESKDLNYERPISLEEAKNKYPDWYKRRVINGEAKGRWKIKRDLYDWWLNKIKTDQDLKVGHRYWCLCVLASYAYKCSFYDEKKNPNPVTEEELRKDSYELLPMMRDLQDDFDEDDIESALNFFQESYVTFPRDTIRTISGLQVPVNKRNGRKRKEHIQLMNFVRDNLNKNTTWNKIGNGRKPKKEIVKQWRLNNPDGKKSDCKKDTGMSWDTIRKWWE